MEKQFLEPKEIIVLDHHYKWKLDNGETIESNHPSLRRIKIQYGESEVTATPFRIPAETDSLYTHKFIEQNNYTNQHLVTIRKQLNRIEFTIQNPTQLITPQVEIFKKPIFKAFEFPKNLSSKFTKAIEQKKRLLGKSKLEPTPILDTPKLQELTIRDARDKPTISALTKTSSDYKIILYYSKTTPPDSAQE